MSFLVSADASLLLITGKKNLNSEKYFYNIYKNYVILITGVAICLTTVFFHCDLKTSEFICFLFFFFLIIFFLLSHTNKDI